MRLIVFLVVLALAVGMFVAPPYRYLPEEEARLKNDPFATSVLAGPIRAWRNWRTCGTVGTCQALRCAALEGGCAPPPPLPWPMSLNAPKPHTGETDNAFRARITAWCAEVHQVYEEWSAYLDAGERCDLDLRPGVTSSPPSNWPSDIPPPAGRRECMPVTADMHPYGPGSPTVGMLIHSYDRHCG